VKLTGWKIDIKSRTRAKELSKAAFENLSAVQGIGGVTAEILYNAGIVHPEDLASVSAEDLMKIPGIGEKKAHNIKESAEEYLNAKERGEEIIDSGDEKEPSRGKKAASPDETVQAEDEAPTGAHASLDEDEEGDGASSEEDDDRSAESDEGAEQISTIDEPVSADADESIEKE
jgi:hypothetical protein